MRYLILIAAAVLLLAGCQERAINEGADLRVVICTDMEIQGKADAAYRNGDLPNVPPAGVVGLTLRDKHDKYTIYLCECLQTDMMIQVYSYELLYHVLHYDPAAQGVLQALDPGDRSWCHCYYDEKH